MQRWRSMGARFAAVLVFGILVLAVLAVFLVSQGRAKADQWASILAAFVGVLAVLGTVLGALWRGRSAGLTATDTLTGAVESLAREQRERWIRQAEARVVGDPWALPVRWESVGPTGPQSGHDQPERIPRHGDFEDILRAFTAEHSTRRLVILGGAGIGKTTLAVRLASALLDRRGPADPVPVWITLNGWPPDEQPLDAWIAEQLSVEYPGLRVGLPRLDGSSRSVAAELVAHDLVLPVLDGLDELPMTRHTDAVRCIADTLARGRQLILTCRTVEYRQAVKLVRPLGRTMVVKLQRLQTPDLVEYLPAATEGPPDRWRAVLSTLDAHPHGTLAATLCTPLMCWLARVRYGRRESSPAELLGLARRGAEAIQAYLLDQLIPTAYATATTTRPARRPAQAERARRHLANLAQLLPAIDSRDIAWWRLHRAVPPTGLLLTLGVVLAVPTGAATAVFGAMTGGLVDVAITGALGVLGGFAAAALGVGVRAKLGGFTERPVALQLRRSQFTTPWSWGIGLLTAAFMLGVTRRILDPAGSLLAGAGLGLLVWLTQGFTGAFSQQLVEGRVRTSGSALRGDRTAAIANGLLNGVPVGLLGGLVMYSMMGWSPGLRSLYVFVLILSLAGGGMMALTGTAWGPFALVRLYLAARGRLPLRLMAFLREAQERGVLGWAGPAYQFRHALLERRLAAPPIADQARPASPARQVTRAAGR